MMMNSAEPATLAEGGHAYGAQPLADSAAALRLAAGCYFCGLALAQAQSLGQLHLPPLSHEQFIRPHAEHVMKASLYCDVQ
jgi:hypothetical protein